MKRLKADAEASGTTPVQSPRAVAPAAQPPAAAPPPMASTAPSRLPERGQPATTPQQTLPTIPELHEEGAAGEHCPWPAARAAAAPHTQQAAAPTSSTAPTQRTAAAAKWAGQQPAKQRRQRQQQQQQQAGQPPDLELKSEPCSEDEAQGSTADTGAAECNTTAACRRRRLGSAPPGYQLIPSPLLSAIPAATLTLPPGSPLGQSPHQVLPLLQLSSPGWALVPWQPPSPRSPLPPLANGATSREHAAGWHLEQQQSPRQVLAGGRKRTAEDKGDDQPAAPPADDATAMSTDEPPSALTIAGLPRQLSDALEEALQAQQAQQAQRSQHSQQPERQRPHHEAIAAVAAAAAAAVAAVAPAHLAHVAAVPVASARALPASSVSCCCESMEE